MKRLFKKTNAFLIVCAILSSVIYPMEANAASDTMIYPNATWLNKAVNYKKTQTVYVSPKDGRDHNNLLECLFPVKNNISAKKIRNVRSSNPQVLKTDGVHNGVTSTNSKKKAVVLSAYMKKPGNATVSFQYNNKTYKIPYKVKKFSNGISSLKLTGYSGNYASRFNSRVSISVAGQKRPSSIQIKMKKGWVIEDVTAISAGIKGFERTLFSSRKGKSNVTVKSSVLKNTDLYVEIYCRNKKTGEEETYYLNFEMLDA